MMPSNIPKCQNWVLTARFGDIDLTLRGRKITNKSNNDILWMDSDHTKLVLV